MASNTPDVEPDDFDLAEAYAVVTPDDNRELYRKWASTYESDFLKRRGYVYHENVAQVLLGAHAIGPVLDVGCGTGVVGEVLAAAGVGPIDGLDLSPEMLTKAAQKIDAAGNPMYRTLIEADLTKTTGLPDDTYQSVISVGTFTFGHLPVSSLAELFRVAAPGAKLAVGVNAAYFAEAEFAVWLGKRQSEGVIGTYDLTEVAIYTEHSDDHGDDRALVLNLTLP